MANYKNCVGMDVKEARAFFKTQGITFRIASDDDGQRMLTQDVIQGRVTVVIEGNKVVSYEVE